MRTILLLTVSNVFMTFAWYGHLKYREVPLFKVIVISWMIAFFEYCFQVTGNRCVDPSVDRIRREVEHD